MLNPFKEINWKPTLEQRQSFGKSLIIGFPIVAVIFLVAGRLHNGEWNYLFPARLGLIGAGVGAIFWFVPQVALPFYLVWYGVAACIGLVVGNVIFVAIYFLLIMPIGFMLRLAGKTPLQMKPDKSAKTYWTEDSTPKDPLTYYRQF